MDKNALPPDDSTEETESKDISQTTNAASEFFLRKLTEQVAQNSTIEDLTQQLLNKISGQQIQPDAKPRKDVVKLITKLTREVRKQSLVDNSVEQLIAKLNDMNWEVRARAAQVLGQKGDVRAVEPLIAALNDPSFGVRYQVIAALGILGDERAAPPLIEALIDPDLNNSFAAHNALKQLGTAALMPLIAALKHESSYIRWSAASLLGDIRDKRALPALTDAKENDATVDPVHGAIKDVAARAIRSINRNLRQTAKPMNIKRTSQTSKFDWETLLQDWSIALLESNDLEEEPPQDVIETQWMGYKGASEEQIAHAETRLGTKFPPSYREFLKVTNGWRQITSFINKLWSVEEIDWFKVRNQGWIDAWMTDLLPVPDKEYFVYGEDQSELAVRREYLQTALEISDMGDSAIYLLNPQVVTPDGEWEAWFFANWLPGATRYRSFWEMMQTEYKKFLALKEY
jgi:hypothetical protein